MPKTMPGLSALLCAVLLAPPAMAGGTLEGRIVTFNVETWDDPARPIFISEGRTVKVGPGVEFGMGPEGHTEGFDVVPVQVEIGADRIEFSYPAGSGEFWAAAFNGYVLRFPTDCALFEEVRIDAAETTIPLKPSDLRTDGGALFINVAGRGYGPGQVIALDVTVGDCALS